MKRWHKALILSLMGGDLYCMVELIWRGHTHWSMFLLAAMLSLPLDLANEHMAWERPLWLPPAGEPVGTGVPEVRPAVGGAGGDRHRAVRLDAALAVSRGAAPLPLDLRGGMQDRNGGALRADRRGGYRTGGWGGIPLPEECQAGRGPGGAPGYGEQAGYGSDVRHLFVVPDHGQKVGGSTYQRRRGGGHACSGDGPHGVYRLRPQRGGPQRQ